MTNLTKEQKDIVLSFYFRCGSDEEIDRARDLIASDPRASQLYTELERSLGMLDSVKYEPCPDNLAEITIAKLRLAASAGRAAASEESLTQQSDIDHLLAQERQKHLDHQSSILRPQFSMWRFAEIGVAAALILLAINTMFPVFSHMRNRAHKLACSANLGSIGMGLSNYQNSNDGRMPYIMMDNDAPWWKVGDQGEKNQSNTRHFWLLVKNDYAEGSNFVCPGREGSVATDVTGASAEKYCDFPSRKNVNYSFALMSSENSNRKNADSISVIMADLNPVFEGITTPFEQPLFGQIALNEQLRQMASTSHNRSGQNVLIRDGSARFNKQRMYLNDDIYTLRGKTSYRGNERPTTIGDVFLVP
jgi:hypothetical protein